MALPGSEKNSRTAICTMGESTRNEPAEGLERRGSARKSVAYRMDVMDASGGLAGCVLDISDGGMRLGCSPQLDVGQTSALWIEFPRWMGLGAGVSLPGRFVWHRPKGPRGPEAGYAFEHHSKKERELLAALIAKIEHAAEQDRVA